MTDNLHPEYGNAIYRFPRTTKEAFGPSEAIFVATEHEEEIGIHNIEWFFALGVYALALVAVMVLWWMP